MANKKEILVVGATAAAVLGGYLLKESFKEDKAEEDKKKHDGHVDSEKFVDKLKDKFGTSKDDEDKNVDKDSESFVDKMKDKIGGSKDDEKNGKDVPPSKLK